MSGTIRIDTREFADAMRRYMPQTKRDLAEVLNQKGYSITIAAPKLTAKAQAARIQADLGVIAYEVKQITRGKNKGKFKQSGMVVSRSSKAEKIVRSRIYAKGGQQPTQAEGKEMAKAFINRMVSHIAYLRSGWLVSVADFARAIGKNVGASARGVFAKYRNARQMGGAIAARPGFNPKATFFNASIAERSHNNAGAVKLIEDGLGTAIAQEIQRMDEHVAKKLQQTANQYNAGHG